MSSERCQPCWHYEPHGCRINRPGYPLAGSKCAAYLPPVPRPLESLEKAHRWAALERLGCCLGWLFGGGA